MSSEATSNKRYPMPFVRIELVVMAVREGNLQVLLARRAEAPHRGSMALPGGVLRIDVDRSLDEGCHRVARERLGIDLHGASQLMSVGGPDRDPRAPWALSVVYWCMAQAAKLSVKAGKRAEVLAWTDAREAAQSDLAFDHERLVEAAISEVQTKVDALQFPIGMLDEPFSLADLQAASEAVLGRPLDKSSFRRRLDAADAVKAVPGAIRTGPFRPAQLYRLGTG